MFSNYLKIALRNIRKYKAYSFINVSGLALGVAVFFIAAQYVTYHLSWDEHLSKRDDLYRIHQKFNDGGTTATVSYPIKQALVDDYPEIEQATSFSYRQNLIQIGDKQIVASGVLSVEPTFFDLFDVEFLHGSLENAQKEFETGTSSAYITDKYAKVLFGDEDPIGKDIRIGDDENGFAYKITGVVRHYPENAHFQFNLLTSIKDRPYFKEVVNNWNNPVVYTYVYIPDKQKAQQFSKLKTLDQFIERHFPVQFGGPEAHLPVKPVSEIHLYSENTYYELGNNGSIILIYTVGSIGILILILASINFMNLTTARATRRAKEVGMRKSLGASRGNLINQFLGEACVFSFISVLLGIGIAGLLLPLFNGYLNENLTLNFTNPYTPLSLLGLAIVLGVLSGLYPAFVLSSFSPINALKDAQGGTKTAGGFLVRKGLVILQFTLVSVMLVTLITMRSQLRYLANKDLGRDFKEMAFVRSTEKMMENPQNYISFIEQLKRSNAIVNVSGFGGWDYQTVDFEGMQPNDRKGSNVIQTSTGFAEVNGLRLLAGRFPSTDIATDDKGILFNETAIKQFGWTPEIAIGKEVKLYEGDSSYTVIGVLQDWHLDDVMQKIEPMAIINYPNQAYFGTLIEVREGQREKANADIEEAWRRFDDGIPFEIGYQQDSVEASLEGVRNIQKMMTELTLLGIIIACMGLYGLTTFSTERRIKEIGIRKVFGASVTGIWRLIVSEFTVLVVIATVVGMLGGYFAGEVILQNFAYRISIGPAIFLIAGALAISIAVLTVSYQAIRSSRINPVDTLKIE